MTPIGEKDSILPVSEPSQLMMILLSIMSARRLATPAGVQYFLRQRNFLLTPFCAATAVISELSFGSSAVELKAGEGRPLKRIRCVPTEEEAQTEVNKQPKREDTGDVSGARAAQRIKILQLELELARAELAVGSS